MQRSDLETVREQFSRVGDSAYWGDCEDWYIVAGRSRDSDCLEQSNFETMQAELEAIDPEAVTIERAGHWAVGWVETLQIALDADAVIDKAVELLTAKEDYPVLDEDDFSRREHEKACEVWDSFTTRDRVDTLQRYGMNTLNARRDYVDIDDDSGYLWEYLITD